MRKYLMLLPFLILLSSCATKEIKPDCKCPDFPVPSNYVIDKLASQNDTEINNWVIRLYQHKKLIEIQNKK